MSVLTAAAANCLWVQAVLLAPSLGAVPAPTGAERATHIVARMEAAYAQVDGYETTTEVRIYRGGKVTETQRFLYVFEKPNRIRLRFETPHSGTVLTYPDKSGQVEVKPGGWFGLLKLHRSTDSSVFKSSAGQRIDQTDLGLLIQNIAHSVTDRRRGEIKITERDGQAVIEVLADDHFLSGVQTLYRFTIDEVRWLPVAVRESTPGGTPKREVTFGNLKISTGAPHVPAPSLGGSPDDGRSQR
jgi:outer membrane lipoprotein-sorting protein